MLPICRDRTAMASGKLLRAGVAVIDGDDETALDACGQLRYVVVGDAGGFDALSIFGMDAVVIEKFEIGSRRGNPGFDETSVFLCDSQFALRTDHLNRQRVEEFVGEDDERDFRG